MTISAETVNGFNLAGFQNPTFDATEVFRCAMDAMARPGQIQDMKALCAYPDSLNTPSAALLLALADMETNIWLSPELDSVQARDFLAFHTGCRIVEDPAQCQFALIDAQTSVDVLKPLTIGSAEFPDRSATVIVSVSSLSNENSLTLTGPGIQDTQSLSVEPLPKDFWVWFANNRPTFPCGVDVIFASENQICAVPRTVKVEG
ncbi:phosphonate C-P lyase system protein PhnH [Terasakiella sp. A23]|uniref:phosphonate C-P lyase system protein PhnH n=1 Tax=Terasakiella sp. FCG-A23 TaxID=3080561 RepID=UPI00295544F5|nr:phosphonate C-P lyase system protein PhnH [Terasakiella sp. A23]MDV7340326.1 phosphonate C-P lyase system protein PhnH [Terasakiella sp. A23]